MSLYEIFIYLSPKCLQFFFFFCEGTSKAGEKYKVGKKMTDLMLEIFNLDKKEIITADAISNQEFSEVGILISK